MYITGEQLYVWLSQAMREWQVKYGLLRPSSISWEVSWNALAADWKSGLISLASKINSVRSELSQAAIEEIVINKWNAAQKQRLYDLLKAARRYQGF
jgi:hypothetical protein